MDCNDYAPLIGGLIDGSADPAAALAARAHMEGCAACQGLAEDLTRLRDAARALEAPAPPAHLWPRIADTLRRERDIGRGPQGAMAVSRATGRVGRRRDSNPRSPVWSWLPAAAALLLVAGGLSWIGTRLTPSARPAMAAESVDGADVADTVDPEAREELQLAEAAFTDAIAGLEAAARAEAPAALNPGAADDWLDGVADLDAAIDEGREAARTDPDSLRARERLLEALRTKMAVLQDGMALMDDARLDGAGGLAPDATSGREFLQ